MGLESCIQAILTLALVIVAILVLAAVRSMRAAIRDLASALRKGQGEHGSLPGGAETAPPSSGVAPTKEPDVRPWALPFRPTAEEQAAARAAHTKTDEATEDERRTVEMPAVQVPAARELPEHTLEADLGEEALARVDALALERGVSRAEMLRILARQGMTAEERRKQDADEGKGKR